MEGNRNTLGVFHLVARNDLLCASEISTDAGDACLQSAMHWSKSVHRFVEYNAEFLHFFDCIRACLDWAVLRT